MSRVVSIQDPAYEMLAVTQAKLNLITKEPNSLSHTVSFSLDITDTWLQKALQEAQRNPNYGKALSEAMRRGDKQETFELLAELLRGN